MGELEDMAKAMHGIDASRRVGWARLYEAQEDLEAARRARNAWAELALTLCVIIRYHQRLHDDDPVVELADGVLSDIEGNPEGRRLVERIKNATL